MSDLDETHDANQTIRMTADSGHMTPSSGHTRSKYGDARQEWIDNLTTSEAEAYRTGRREAALEHQTYVRAYISYQRVLKKIARGEFNDPAAAARFILHEPAKEAE